MVLESKFIELVMSFAVKHKAKEIEILVGVDYLNLLELPNCIYNSTVLEKLTLSCPPDEEKMCVEKSMGFTTLKELRLHCVDFSEGLNEDIFPRCPVLETLSLVGCCFDRPGQVVSAPRLKTLEIVFLMMDKLSFKSYEFLISTPMLSCFKFEGPEPVQFTLDNYTSSLEEIDIIVLIELSDEPNARKEWFVERQVKMFREFRNAKYVIVSWKTLEVLSTVPSLLEGQESPVANLKNLHLKTNWSKLAPGLSFLRKISPNVNASL